MSRRPEVDGSPADSVAFVVGVVALALALVVAFGGSLADPIVAALSPVFGPGFVTVGGLLAGGLAVYAAYGRSRAPERVPGVDLPSPPSRRAETAAPAPGGRLDTLVDEVHATDLDDDVSRVDTSVNRKRVRERVHRLAVDVLQETTTASREEVARRIETGEWTERPRAKVFLGEDVPRLPLSVRLRDWASGEGFRRRAAATVEEVAIRAGVDHGDSVAPPPVGVDPAALERDPVDWPPAPDADETDRLDRLLDRPDEAFERVAPSSDSDPEPASEPDPATNSPATDATDVFRREVIVADPATGDAAASEPSSQRAAVAPDGAAPEPEAEEPSSPAEEWLDVTEGGETE